MKRSLGFTIASALILAAGPAVADPPLPISECGTPIFDPGRYVVTQDLYCAPNQQGIVVLASDVTVDLRGHTISCDTSGDILTGAVLVGDYFDPSLVLGNVKIRNGTVSGCHDGVIFFYTESGKITGITSTQNIDGGITLVGARNTKVRNNTGIDNQYAAIRSYYGHHNVFKRNYSTGNFVAVEVADETGSKLVCNTSEYEGYGMSVVGLSTENLVRGNYVTNADWVGVLLWDFLVPDVYVGSVPYDNVVKKNIVLSSGIIDLFEGLFDVTTESGVILDDAACLNKWKKNQYSTWMAPENCIAAPVELDDDHVCALQDEDECDDD